MKPAGRKAPAASSAWPSDMRIKMNVYGRSGTGKTTFWATFPGPVLALVCSGGSQPGELRSIDTPAYRKKINPVIVSNSRQIRTLLEQASDYETVVLDHASGLQDLVLKEILGLDELPAQGSWGMAAREQWGQCALQVKELLRALLSLPQNVVVVAQEREFNTEVESDLLMPYVASALTPSIVGWLNPACDYIVQTFIRRKTEIKEVKVGTKMVPTKQKVAGVEYCLRVAPDDVFTTKFRLPKGHSLPLDIVDPDYDKVVALINGR
jgi:hypothetical protein